MSSINLKNDRRKTLWLSLLIFAFVLTIRVGYIYSNSHSDFLGSPHSDHLNYFHWARLLSEGSPRPLHLTIQQPAYAYLLALLYRLPFAADYRAVRLIHVLIASAAAVLFFAAARRVLGIAWGAVAAIFLAICPAMIFAEASWSKETVAVACWLLAINTILSPRRFLRWLGFCAIILAVGLRDLFLLPAMLAYAAWLLTHRQYRRVVMAGLLAIIILGGWHVMHTWTRGGIPPQGFAQPLYAGLWSGTGIIQSPPPFIRGGRRWEAIDWHAETVRRLGVNPDPQAENWYWLRAAGKEFIAHPTATLTMFAQRLVAGFWGGPLEDNYPYLVYYHSSELLPLLPPVWLLIALGLGGSWVWYWSGKNRVAWIIVTAVIVGTILAMVPFYVVERMRLPLYPCLALAAAAGFKYLPLVKKRHLLAYGLGVFIAINPWLTEKLDPYVYQGTAIGWKLLALNDLAAGQPASALAAYRQIEHLSVVRRDASLQPLRDLAAVNQTRPAAP